MHIALFESRHPVIDRKNQLVKDLKGVVVDADDLLQELANSTAEEFSAARAGIEQRLKLARAGLDEARSNALRSVAAAADATQAYARENPWKAIGLPVAAGLLVAFVLSRR